MGPTCAHDRPGTGVAAAAWRETSVGGETTDRSWSIYSTLTVAPLDVLDRDGLRLRVTGGYGRYSYAGSRRTGESDVPTTFRGVQSFSDVLGGYQMQFDLVTLKAFAGVSAINHAITPFDLGNEVSGLDFGFKAVLEIWAELGAGAWAALDLSWSAAHETYASRARLGWRALPALSIGVEGGLIGNQSYDGGRAGLFVRYAADWGEVSLSGGLVGDIDHPDNPYAAANWLVRF